MNVKNILPISPLLWDEHRGLHCYMSIASNQNIMRSFNSLSPIRLKKSAFAKRASRILNGPRWLRLTSPEFMILLQYLDSLKMPPFTDCWLDQNALPNVSSLIYSVSDSMSPKFSLASLIFSSNLASRHARHFMASNEMCCAKSATRIGKTRC